MLLPSAIPAWHPAGYPGGVCFTASAAHTAADVNFCAGK